MSRSNMISDHTSDSSSTSQTTAMAQASNPSPSPLNNAHHFISIKLTSSNYLFWKTQVCSFLRGQELFGYVDGSYVCPPSHMAGKNGEQDVVNPTYIRWIKQDQLIMNLIISSLSEETIPIVIGLPTTKSIWDALEAAFSSPSNTRILNLRMQLQNLKQEDLSVT
ncbi:hypothetical protein AABB24_005414 [Solanum stoloniferum]|uniref:Retrotransposon Copia-like N-terminal domain-containing protein n=1 Tax=Solanum stoloniferum TaxID=62892 RepID=A0ABD2UYZ8_9SOLN